ncbi:MAG: DNA alkylation repair protein [Candidatus Nanopelagicus sp.]
MSSAAAVTRKMQGLANKKLASAQQGFYQTQPGGYGAGDKFLGISVPHSRKVAKEYKELPLSEIKRLSTSPFHEIRFVTLTILVIQFRAAKDQRVRKRLYETYISMVKGGGIVNNWDLVDASAPYFGEYLIDHPDRVKILMKLAKNKDLWVQRVAIILTFALIRAGNNKPTLILAKEFLNHPHDLIHKATGWMLREAGKRDLVALRGFLKQHVHQMPRTMLRYSIEQLPKSERKRWLLK